MSRKCVPLFLKHSVNGIIFFFGIIFNLLVVYSNFVRRTRRAPNLFEVSLPVWDLITAILSVPLPTLYQTFGWCHLFKSTARILSIVSAYTVAVISMQQFLKLKYPMKERLSKRMQGAVISITFICASMVVVPANTFRRVVQSNETISAYCEE